ncbi:MAG: DUF1015 family protein [Pseudomonadota bacterium]
MSLIRAFKGLRPVPSKVALVASPPYDVLNSKEAREMARGNPLSFLHVVKPEIDLDPGINLYADEVYAKGAENFRSLIEQGVMVLDPKECLYLYEQTMQFPGGKHVQVGVVCCASVDEYQNDLIKKHEFTRPDKEKDRTRHVDTLGANAGPVFLTYRADPKIDALVTEAYKTKPACDFVADDGVGHRFWVVEKDDQIRQFIKAFAKVPHSYVADGHHRSASASGVREIRKAANLNHTGDEEYNFFLAVFFPHNQLAIMDYNRVVMDLAGLSEDEFLGKAKEKFEVEKTDTPKPTKATEFGMYLGRTWWRLKAKPGTYNSKDPVASLDVAILQDNLLTPILGIEDPRRDKRIDFVGGIRGLKELERRVQQGAAVAFAMYPTSIGQLMAIADEGKTMPPKSTWFEPKLRSGLVVHLLD